MALHHRQTTPGTSANMASEALRELNRATIDPRTCTLHDVYSVLGALGELSTRLQQATRQMAEVVSARLAAGNLSLEFGDVATLEDVVRNCHDQLGSAASAAGRLANSLR